MSTITIIEGVTHSGKTSKMIDMMAIPGKRSLVILVENNNIGFTNHIDAMYPNNKFEYGVINISSNPKMKLVIDKIKEANEDVSKIIDYKFDTIFIDLPELLTDNNGMTTSERNENIDKFALSLMIMFECDIVFTKQFIRSACQEVMATKN